MWILERFDHCNIMFVRHRHESGNSGKNRNGSDVQPDSEWAGPPNHGRSKLTQHLSESSQLRRKNPRLKDWRWGTQTGSANSDRDRGKLWRRGSHLWPWLLFLESNQESRRQGDQHQRLQNWLFERHCHQPIMSSSFLGLRLPCRYTSTRQTNCSFSEQLLRFVWGGSYVH